MDPFGSVFFRKFASQYGFVHNTSSPLYPISNGKSVKIAKRLIRKAVESRLDPFLAVLNFRNTTNQHYRDFACTTFV